jgi:hypothetical protein
LKSRLSEELKKIKHQGIPRWGLEGGSRKLLPKVKSWRDAGDIHYGKTTEKRQNTYTPTTPTHA